MSIPTNGKDRLRFGDAADTIDALGGNDTIWAGGGDDTLFGGLGKDRLYGEAGDDVIWGGAGKNTLDGGDGRDSLFGGDDNDLIYGGNGNDVIYGFEGKNRLYGDDGNDWIYSGSANDTLSGGTGDDILESGDGKDRLLGDEGDDRIEAGRGNDVLFGGSGIDRLSGQQDDDRIDGGDGIDYAFFSGNWADYRITMDSAGLVTVMDLRGEDGTDRLTSVERLMFYDRTVTIASPDPDGTFAGATPINATDLQEGRFSTTASLDLPDDVDIWRISLLAGQRVTAAVDSGASNDPRTDIAAYDGTGRFIAVNNDDSKDDPEGPIPPSMLSFTAQESGIHYIAISGFGHVPTGDDDPDGPNFNGFSGQSGDYVFNLFL